MTAKRYYAHKHLISEDKVHDKICHRFMNITETVEHMNMYYQKYTALKKENEQLKGSLYAEKTNTAEVTNEYSKQFKRHSKEFSFMIDLAEDLGVDVSKLEAKDD